MVQKIKKSEYLSEVSNSNGSKKNIVVPLSSLVWGMLFFIALGAAGYFYYQAKHPAPVTNEEEKKDLVGTLGEYLDLPSDETPTLATITDVEKLIDQPFFSKAENGDKVLIYSQSGKAILYRPSTKKVIDMTSADVEKPSVEANVDTQEESTSQEVQELAARVDLTVTLLNGSTKGGATNEAEKKITESLEDYTIEKKVNALKNNYQGTIIIDREGDNNERAQELAALLGGKVESLPEGENGTSDIIIIIGNE